MRTRGTATTPRKLQIQPKGPAHSNRLCEPQSGPIRPGPVHFCVCSFQKSNISLSVQCSTGPPPPMKTFFWRLSPCIPSGRPMMGRESIPWTGLAKPLDPEGPPPAQATLDPGLVRARSQPIGLRTMLSLHYCQIWDGYDYKDIWPNGCGGAGF